MFIYVWHERMIISILTQIRLGMEFERLSRPEVISISGVVNFQKNFPKIYSYLPVERHDVYGVEVVAGLRGARRAQRVAVDLDPSRGRDRVGGYRARLLGVVVTGQLEGAVLEKSVLAYHVLGSCAGLAAEK